MVHVYREEREETSGSTQLSIKICPIFAILIVRDKARLGLGILLILCVGRCAQADILKLAKAHVLQEWLIRSGGTVHPFMQVGYTESKGYELRASGLINPNEILVTVPQPLQLYATGTSGLHELAIQLSRYFHYPHSFEASIYSTV